MPKTPEIPEMTPEEDACLRRALRRDDALCYALAVIQDNPSSNPQAQQEMLEELESLSEEAGSQVARLKRIYGFKNY